MAHLSKETLLQVVRAPELVTQDPEGARGITKAFGGLCRRKTLDKIGTQGFILAM
jgi:hypothetical protein